MKYFNLTLIHIFTVLLLCLIFGDITLAQTLPENGLVAHYPFNGNANDESGNGNDGTVLGAALTTDRFGNSNSAYDFDGIDDYILINDSPTLDVTDEITITAWIKADEIGTNDVILNKNFNTSWSHPYFVYSLQIVSQAIDAASASVAVNTTRQEISSTNNSISVGNWHFIVTTYDGETIKIYVDGQFENQNTNPSGSINTSNEIVTIGAAHNGAHGFVDGIIDDISIYNRALTIEEIEELYTPNITPNNPPVAIAQNITVSTSECTIDVTPQQIDNGSSDPDGDILSYVLEPAGPYSVGDNPVSLIVSDGVFSDTASSIITVTGGCPDGLLAYYSFTGNANDESGLGNNGTVLGATLSGDLCNNLISAYYFDGIDDYIDLGNSNILKPQLPVTVAAWVKFNGVGNIIFTNNYTDNSYYGIWMYQWGPGGHVIISYGDGGGVGDVSRRAKKGQTVLDDGTWTHVVGIIRGPTDMDIYINSVNDGGIYQGTGGNLTYNSGSGNIGRQDHANSGPPTFANGSIDEIYFYNRVLSEEEIFELYNITCPNSPPVAIAQNLTIPTTTECTANVTPQQVDNGSSDPDGDNLNYILEPAGPYSVGDNAVSLIVSDGVFSDTASSIITVTGGSGEVIGQVTGNGNGLENIIVKLLEGANPTNFIETATNETGTYTFSNVALDSYQVMIVVPLGYILDNNFVPLFLECGSTANVDFNLNEIVLQNNARSKGYWKHQFDVYVKEKGNAQETAEQLQNYIDEVHARYALHFNLFDGITSFEDWQDILSVKGNAGMEAKAISQIAALTLNIMSLKIGQFEVVTDDGFTAGDVLTFVSGLILDGDGSNDELAKDLAENICNQQTIASGIVNPSQNTLYKGFAGKLDENLVPTEYGVLQNYPNPFNPETRISYALPVESTVNLTVYDISGRVISTLVNRTQSAGVYQVIFNANNLTSGVYFYVMKASSFNQIRRMLLIK